MIAGAAEGLGAAFSEILAVNGFNLILIDKEDDKLAVVADRIRDKYQVQVTQIICDLAKTDQTTIAGIEDAYQRVNCRLLVYNAAYGPVKGFLHNDPDELDYYLNVNSRMPLLLAHGFAKTHLGGDPAGFVLMSSMAGLRGTQLVTPYAATKAFDWNLMEGLFYEFRQTNMDFTSCCAGPINTPNYRKTKPTDVAVKPKDQDPFLVATEALKGLGKKAIVLPGASIAASETFLKHILSRSQASKLANKTMAKIYADKWKGRFNKSD